MIRIRACRLSDGWEITAAGHAGYAERGRDIVCAGVSALLFGFLHHLIRTHRSAIAAGEAVGQDSRGLGDAGDRRAHGDNAPSPSVAYRVGEGTLWVRTHGMNGADTAAWAVTRTGLSLIAEDHPACVLLAETEGTAVNRRSTGKEEEHGHGECYGGA